MFTGKLDNYIFSKLITIRVFRKKHFSIEKLLEGSLNIGLETEEPVFSFQNIQNSLVSVNMNIISYKLGKGLI